MKAIKLLAIIMAVCLCAVFSACTDKEKTAVESTTVIESIETTSPETTVQVTTQKQTEPTIKTYMTRFEEVNAVTYPTFLFDYPDNWTVTKEEVDHSSEIVVLENGEGATIWFCHIGGAKGEDIGGGSNTNMARVEVTQIANSQFVPTTIQATDYSDLGEFMVAELRTTGVLDMRTDRDYTDVDGWVSYAVLPKTEIGIRENVNKAYSGEFTFWYGGNISFTGGDSKDDFTLQEKTEIIAILSSFRAEY